MMMTLTVDALEPHVFTQPQRQDVAHEAITHKKVLIVEDDENISQLLEMKLTMEGFDVQVCYDGETGLDCMRSFHPDIVILDGMMPRLDGMAVLIRMREDEAIDNVPVLMLSARSKDDYIVSCLSLGADDFVTKPFSLSVLIMRVKKLLSK